MAAGQNGLTAALQTLLSNSSVTETSLNQMAMLNELGYRLAAGTLEIAANGQFHVHDLSIDSLTVGVFGNTTIGGWANLESTLDVAGNAVFRANVTVNGTLSGDGTGLTLGSGTANSMTFLAGDHTYKEITVPIANTTANGLVSTVAQSLAGVKTFTDNVAVSKLLIAGQETINAVVNATFFAGTAFGNVFGFPTATLVRTNPNLNWHIGFDDGFNNDLSVAAVEYAQGEIQFAVPLGGGSFTTAFIIGGPGGIESFVDVTMQPGTSIRTGLQNGFSFNLSARDTGSGIWHPFLTLVSNTTPSLTIVPPTNGTVAITANTLHGSAMTLDTTLSANSGVGSAGQVLTSGGTGANAYWATVSSYGTIEVAGQANLVAQSVNAVATFAADAGIVLTTNVASDGALHIGGAVANTTAQGDVSTAAQSFAGVKTFTDNVAVDKAVTVTGNLTVSGVTTLNGLLTANAGVTVNGAVAVNSTVSANGDVGTAGQVLTSAGAGANAYWSTAAGGASVPTGTITMFGGTSAPSGWLLCDGSAVSRTTNAALFAVLGTTYGAGDGSTTFNLPDLRQRFPLGKAASGTGSTLGATGGAIDHTHTSAAHTHTYTQVPNHTHPITDPGHVHNILQSTGSGGSLAGINVTLTTSRTFVSDFTQSATTGITVNNPTGGVATATTASTTPGATGSNNPPYVTVSFIVKM